MSSLKALQSAASLSDLAALLGYKAKSLSFILYVKSEASKYSSFTIPKKAGGFRQIDAPSDDLKLVQQRLARLIQNCSEEIRFSHGAHDDGPNPDQIAHGFRRHRSIATNAARHRHRRHVLNLDLTDFFPSCNFGRVRGILIKDRNFALHPTVATVIAHIACFKGALAQGSPCSPCISNLIAHILDIHLAQLAGKVGCVYSRYADDLTFSTNHSEVPTTIAFRDENNVNTWSPGAELTRLIIKSGFAINPTKTRMQYRNSRQEVTGLVVNERVNVRSEYRHMVRAMVHRVLNTGTFEHTIVAKDSTGKLIKVSKAGTLAELQGMLGFIDAIDRKYRSPEDPKAQGKKEKKLSAYAHFLLFKNFYAAGTPVVLCEGKTDNVYLTHAMRRLAPAFPKLALQNPDGTIKLLVRRFKYAGKNTGKTISLFGGSGDLCKFIATYKSAIATYKAPGLLHPIIILVDNDEGGKAVKTAAEAVSKKKFSGSETFVHLVANLYLVWTPLALGATSSCIEDGFDTVTKGISVDGKNFDPAKDSDTETTYGKVVFAYKVVEAHADKIDFSGFVPLLTRISQVIEQHHLIMASAPVAA